MPPLTLPPADERISPTEAAASEAVRLFIERAQAVRPDFRLTDTNADAVVAICQRLDGLPLALELASARLAHLPLTALQRRLEHRLPLLTSGPRDLPARLRTMRDAIAWSYDLLTLDEQALFRRLAVFVGGFTLEAAEEIVGGTGTQPLAVLDGIASLVGKSLVQVIEVSAGEPRYQMLETIREYGLEQLAASSEAGEIGQRHALFFANLAECLGPAVEGPDQRSALESLDADEANLRAAIMWAIAHQERTLALRIPVALWWVLVRPRPLPGGLGVDRESTSPDRRSTARTPHVRPQHFGQYVLTERGVRPSGGYRGDPGGVGETRGRCDRRGDGALPAQLRRPPRGGC